MLSSLSSYIGVNQDLISTLDGFPVWLTCETSFGMLIL